MKFTSIAVFIDAENCPHTLVDEALNAISELGAVAKIFAYGDFSNPSLKHYRGVVQRHNITAMQVFSRLSGKNSADIAIAMDAVELASLRRHDAFAIVSSDSDFNRLAQKLRDSGIYVIAVSRDASNATAYDKILIINKNDSAQENLDAKKAKVKKELKTPETKVNLDTKGADTDEKGALTQLAKRALKWLNAKKDDSSVKSDLGKAVKADGDISAGLSSDSAKPKSETRKPKKTIKSSDKLGSNSQEKAPRDVREILREFWLANRRVSSDGFIHCSLFGSALRDKKVDVSLKQLGYSRLGKLFDALEKEGFLEQKMDESAPKFRIKESK